MTEQAKTALDVARDVVRAWAQHGEIAIGRDIVEAYVQRNQWVCPKCALTLWREHMNSDGTLTCPLCDDLPAAVQRAREEDWRELCGLCRANLFRAAHARESEGKEGR